MQEYLMAISGIPPANLEEEEQWKLHLATQRILKELFPVPDYIKSMWRHFSQYGT